MNAGGTRSGPILLVEDNPDYALLVRLALRHARILAPLHVVGDGEAAVEYLRGCRSAAPGSGRLVPALILLDLSLPARSGFEVLEWMGAEGRYESVPVVVLSSSSDARDIQRARALRVEDYVVKPTRFADLVTVLARLARRWLGAGRGEETAGEASS